LWNAKEFSQRRGWQDVLATVLLHPQNVFVATYDTFAMRAFEVNTRAYHSKPLDGKILANS